jgi:tetratricopeptide (TPR) repeat protein
MSRLLMIIISLFIFMIVLTKPINAVLKTRLAIIGFDNITKNEEQEWIGYGCAESLTSKLSSIKSIALVERNQIQKVMKEHVLGLSGAIDEETAVKLGKLLGANVVCIGSYQYFQGVLQFDVRFVNTETGQVTDAYQTRDNFEKLFQIYDNIALHFIGEYKVEATPTELNNVEINKTEVIEAHKYITMANQILYGQKEAVGWSNTKLDQTKYREALDLYKKAFSADSAYLEAATGIADCLGYLGETTQAIKYYKEAIELYKNKKPLDAGGLSTALYNLGNTYLSLDQKEEAIQYWEQSLTYSDILPSPYLNLGIVYDQKNEYNLAEKNLLEAIRKCEILGDFEGMFIPTHAKALNTLGFVYWKMKKIDKARDTFRDYVYFCRQNGIFLDQAEKLEKDLRPIFKW